MSKQPSAPGRPTTRLSRPVGFIRDLPIWTKLGLIMVVPTLATIIVGTVGLLDHVQEAENADRARTLAVLSGDAGTLVHRLQDERAAAIRLLNAPSSPKDEVTRLTGDYQKLQDQTENARAAYGQSRLTLADTPDALRALLDGIEVQLGELPAMRSQVEERSKIPRSVAERRYRVLIADLLEIRTQAAQLTGDITLSDRLRAASAIGNAKEYTSQERVIILEAQADHELSEAARRDYVATRNGQDLALGTFAAVATPDQVAVLNRALTGPEFRESLLYEGGFDSLDSGEDPNSVVSADKWDAAMAGRADLMNTVEVAFSSQAEQAAVVLGNRVQRQVLVETVLLLATLVLGVLFAWLVARSMARSLRDLRQGALAVAQYGLPQAVQRLRDPALSTNSTPAAVASQIAEPLPVRSADEFGQVTEAFNAVHLEAVRTAAEQAALRASVATMFVNLARRSQILVDRLIGHLDRLERGEQDPDRLSELFQLDHLATRMRRNDENLLVLAGADSTRIQREPAALMDVLRAAQSEVEHYTRIEFGQIDPDIEIAAHAVNDMVHLVAELFDNATAFSAPDTKITVEARRLGERAILQVEDRGIGMSPEQYSELNERLASPPIVDVAVSRMMGLVVVARLAARHGVKTELRPARERGTVAEVSMPNAVLVPRALAGRTQMPSGFPAAVPRPGLGTGMGLPAASPPRPSLPAPLALESGPSTTPLWGSPPGSGYQPPAPAFGGAAGAAGGAAAAAGGLAAAAGGLAAAFGGRSGSGPARGSGPADSAGPSVGAPPGPAGPTSGPPAGSGPGGLGAALAGEPTGWGPGAAASLWGPPSGPATSNGSPAPASRNLPAWSDLTGADAQPSGTGPAGTPDNPLPHRRPTWEPDPGGAEPPSAEFTSPIPRQPGSPDGPPPAPAATSLPPPPLGVPGGPPAAARPPVWPPVAAASQDAVPALPESLSSALDMTSELPRLPGDSLAPPSRYADDLTMELPIFRELESAWFRSGESGSDPSDSWSTDDSGSTAMVGSAVRSGGTDNAASASGAVSWRSAADEGWLAAQAALAPQAGGETDKGLPRRVPMAQLVPGGVEVAPGSSERRTPDSVRGLLSAYTRGVQRGRGAHAHAEPETGSQTSGKEQEA